MSAFERFGTSCQVAAGAAATRGSGAATGIDAVWEGTIAEPPGHVEQTAPGGHVSSSHAPPTCSIGSSHDAYAVAIPLVATIVAARMRIRRALSIGRSHIRSNGSAQAAPTRPTTRPRIIDTAPRSPTDLHAMAPIGDPAESESAPLLPGWRRMPGATGPRVTGGDLATRASTSSHRCHAHGFTSWRTSRHVERRAASTAGPRRVVPSRSDRARRWSARSR